VSIQYSLCVIAVKESDESLYKPSLELMRIHIRSSTTSMTSVPKPLKFLRPHYAVLKDVYEKITDVSTKVCSTIKSV
jgi:26S proteasome regulatory subunit N1